MTDNTLTNVPIEDKTALVFPGQGAQQLGMAKDFYENFKVAQHIFEEASDTCRLNLVKLSFEGPLDKLTETQNLQPALVTTEAAIWAVLNSESPLDPTFAAGHSLGEYSALIAAGALSVATSVKLVAARGAAMQAACPPGLGSMAAILGLEDDTVRSLCEIASLSAAEAAETAELKTQSTVEPANFNAPGQVVIAGHARAVQTAIALCGSDERFKRAKAIPLVVSAPFHCSLMQPARDLMSAILTNTLNSEASQLKYPVVANLDAQPNPYSDRIAGLLTEQIVKPVLWSKSMQTLRANGVSRLIEIGPGKVLAGLQKRIDREVEVVNIGSVAEFKAFIKGANSS